MPLNIGVFIQLFEIKTISTHLENTVGKYKKIFEI